MRHVPRVQFNGQAWDDWIAQCATALSNVGAKPAADRSKTIKANEHVYKAATPFLKRLFGEKCAYCEAPFDSGRLEVEHFRPKLRACDQQNKPIRAVQGGRETQHGGYYWLAFCWENLLPGCTSCNQLPAKANKFPLANENTRVWEAAGLLDKEELWLLDPCRDHPEDHLNFDTVGKKDAGSVVPRNRSEKGRISIDVYKLNRDGLITARLRELFTIDKAKNVAVSAENLGVEEFKKAVDDIRLRCAPDKPYSALWVAKTAAFLSYAENRMKTMMAGD
jgi:hypothetical protein